MTKARKSIRTLRQCPSCRAYYILTPGYKGKCTSCRRGIPVAIDALKVQETLARYDVVCESCGRLRLTKSREGKLCFQCGEGNYLRLTGAAA